MDKLYNDIIFENEQLLIDEDIKSILAGGLIAANTIMGLNNLDAKQIKTPIKKTLTVPSDNYNYNEVIKYCVKVIKILEGSKRIKGIHVTYDDLNPNYIYKPKKETFESFKKNCKGKPTIGYGQTDEKYVKQGIMLEPQAQQLVKQRVKKIYQKLQKLLDKDFTYLTILQKGMLVSLYYNLGTDFSKTPNLVQALKDHNYPQAAKEFLDCNKTTINGKKVAVKGLTNRRNRESRIFLITPKQLQEYQAKQKLNKINNNKKK